MMQHRPTLFTALLFALLVSPYVSKGQEVMGLFPKSRDSFWQIR